MSEQLRRIFAGIAFEPDDLLLLEDFQIGYLPGWVPEREFAAVLHANPAIRRWMAKKHRPIEAFVERILGEHGPAGSKEELDRFTGHVLTTIIDLLGYNRAPEAYDRAAFHQWNFAEVTDLADLKGKIVLDGGAGTGRVALEAAGYAKWVLAVEPVTRLRRFIRERALAEGLTNVFVMDGFLHDLPVPRGFVDVLITSHALGWQLDGELAEFERVVKSGGMIIHCPGTSTKPSAQKTHERLISPPWSYHCAVYTAPDGQKRKYWKQAQA